MIDLYAELKVDRKATKADIRKAYRRRAKEVHPDNGETGSRAKFDLASKALAVLTDEQRRRLYDETGKIDEPAPDLTEGNARQLVTMEVNHVMQVAEQRGMDIEAFDVIKDVKTGLQRKIDSAERDIANGKKAVKKLSQIAKKFSSKKGKANLITPMIEAQAIDIERGIATGEKRVEEMKRALEIAGDHSFAYKAPTSWY